MALSQDNLPILRLLSDVTLRMIEGELLEIESNGDLDVTEADHLDIIRRKTADLFSACLHIGAILGEVGDGARAGPRPLRAEPRDLLPDGGRPPRLHGGREDAGQAGGQRPPRGQADAAHDLPAPQGGPAGDREGPHGPRGPGLRPRLPRRDRAAGPRERGARRGPRAWPSSTPRWRGATSSSSSARRTAKPSRPCPTSSSPATTRPARTTSRPPLGRRALVLAGRVLAGLFALLVVCPPRGPARARGADGRSTGPPGTRDGPRTISRPAEHVRQAGHWAARTVDAAAPAAVGGGCREPRPAAAPSPTRTRSAWPPSSPTRRCRAALDRVAGPRGGEVSGSAGSPPRRGELEEAARARKR